MHRRDEMEQRNHLKRSEYFGNKEYALFSGVRRTAQFCEPR